jgi:hypothetical protein
MCVLLCCLLREPRMVRAFAEGPMAEQINKEEPASQDPNQVRTMAVASKRTTLSQDTLRRTYPHYIVQLSPRRQGITERNIQRIATGGK